MLTDKILRVLAEDSLALPLTEQLRKLLLLRAHGPLSRIERAALRKELFDALDAATGTKGAQ